MIICNSAKLGFYKLSNNFDVLSIRRRASRVRINNIIVAAANLGLP